MYFGKQIICYTSQPIPEHGVMMHIILFVARVSGVAMRLTVVSAAEMLKLVVCVKVTSKGMSGPKVSQQHWHNIYSLDNGVFFFGFFYHLQPLV